MLNCKAIFDRMRAGEKLRWVPRSVSGMRRIVIDGKTFETRDLFLGRTKLNREEQVMVIEAERNGELIESNHIGCIDYVLSEQAAKGGGE
jgi:hypothetical protein